MDPRRRTTGRDGTAMIRGNTTREGAFLYDNETVVISPDSPTLISRRGIFDGKPLSPERGRLGEVQGPALEGSVSSIGGRVVSQGGRVRTHGSSTLVRIVVSEEREISRR